MADILLSVPYFTQRNNPSVGPNDWRNTCNSSCHAMLVEFLKPGSLSRKYGLTQSDTYYIQGFLGSQESTDHSVHTRILRQFGIKSEWRYNLTYDDLDEALGRGYPAPIGVAHRGSISSPTGGHVILVVGRETRAGKEGYLVHDPWGYGFAYQSTNGESVFYPKEPSLNARWLMDGPTQGWGRVIVD